MEDRVLRHCDQSLIITHATVLVRLIVVCQAPNVDYEASTPLLLLPTWQHILLLSKIMLLLLVS